MKQIEQEREYDIYDIIGVEQDHNDGLINDIDEGFMMGYLAS